MGEQDRRPLPGRSACLEIVRFRTMMFPRFNAPEGPVTRDLSAGERADFTRSLRIVLRGLGA